MKFEKNKNSKMGNVSDSKVIEICFRYFNWIAMGTAELDKPKSKQGALA